MKRILSDILDDRQLLMLVFIFAFTALLFALMAPAFVVAVIAGVQFTLISLAGTALLVHVFSDWRKQGKVELKSFLKKDSKPFANLQERVYERRRKQPKPEQQ